MSSSREFHEGYPSCMDNPAPTKGTSLSRPELRMFRFCSLVPVAPSTFRASSTKFMPLTITQLSVERAPRPRLVATRLYDELPLRRPNILQLVDLPLVRYFLV